MGIHGWRLYTVELSQKDWNTPVLAGLRRREALSSRSEPAECIGFDKNAVWITEETRNTPAEERHPPDALAPQYHCTCGYYGHRLWPKPPFIPSLHVYVHATCIRTAEDMAAGVEDDVVIHSEGWRARRYRMDYIVIPPPMEVVIGAELVYQLYGMSGMYGQVEKMKGHPLSEIVAGVAAGMNVPIIPFDDPDACWECREASREAKCGPDWSEAWFDGKKPEWVKGALES